MLASAWDDRFMVIADSAEETPRLRYENYRNGLVRVERVSPSLPELILFMANDPRPEDRVPGLGMSYSEVVGALHALYDAGATRASFATETDKLMAELVEAARTGQVLERPETIADRNRPTDSDDGLVSGRLLPEGRTGPEAAGCAPGPQRDAGIVGAPRLGMEYAVLACGRPGVTRSPAAVRKTGVGRQPDGCRSTRRHGGCGCVLQS